MWFPILSNRGGGTGSKVADGAAGRPGCQETCIMPRAGVHFSNEVRVKNSMMRSFVVLSLLIVALAGCRQEKTVETTTAVTQTIAPASAPSAPNGSDAMTQTVDVEDSRSEAEGGTLTTSGSSGSVPPAATTSVKPAPPKASAKKKP
jgi:hypothetical protein